MIAEGPLERLSDLLAAGSTDAAGRLVNGRPLAVGWATVELDRAAVELGAALRVAPDIFEEAVGTLALGARCRIAAGILPDGISLLLLEPNTEGRLAATLARHAEGPAAVWLAVADLAGVVDAVRSSGRSTTAPQPGPFGTECLLDGPIHGPHHLLVERPGTIRA